MLSFYKIVYRYIAKNLIINKELNKKQKQIFSILLKADNEGRNLPGFKHVSEKVNNDWRIRKLVTYCLYRALTIFVVATLCGENLTIKKKLNEKTKTIIDDSNFYLWTSKQLNSEWIREKWYLNNLPVVLKLNKEFVVIDGNHRLAQQIFHNEIKYHYIEVNKNWLKILLALRKIKNK